MHHAHRRAVPAGALLVLVWAVLAARPVPAAPHVESVLSGLEVPWALAFAPDRRLFITERPGRIRVAVDGRLAAEPVARLDVTHTSEGGLMGLALDPGFARNGHLYVCYTLRKSAGVINRVARLTLKGRRAGDERVLLDDMRGGDFHNGCRLKFGPDGKLYVTMGDASIEQLARRRESLSGKILRINADGSVPDDNPFKGSPVFSIGHRNPQGLAWDDRGRLWESEHGSAAHDEINVIRAGQDYGWPEVRGPGRREGLVPPVLESGELTWAPSGIAFLRGHLYVAGLRSERMLQLQIGADGHVGAVTELLRGAYGRLRDVVAGPDGALWITTNNRDGRGTPRAGDDRVLRMTP